MLIFNISTGRVNEYELSKLTPYTTYEIFVAAGNDYGFGDESVTSFSTSEGECTIWRISFKATYFIRLYKFTAYIGT